MYNYTTDMSALQAYLSGAAVVSFDFETAPYPAWQHDGLSNLPVADLSQARLSGSRAALDPHKAQIVGVSFSVAEGSAIYVPMAHMVGENAWRPGIWAFLREFAANPNVIKVAHNLAFEAAFLYAEGVVLQPPCYDTIAAAQLSLKSHTEFRSLGDSGLKTLVRRSRHDRPEGEGAWLFGVEMPSFETVTAGRFFDELDPANPATINYACADADYTLRLYHKINAWFDAYLPKHRFIAEQVESPTAAYCGLMRYNGLLVDRALMEAKQAEAEQKLEQLRGEIAGIIGDVKIGANLAPSLRSVVSATPNQRVQTLSVQGFGAAGAKNHSEASRGHGR